MIKIQGAFYFCLHYSLFVIDLVYNAKEITFAMANGSGRGQKYFRGIHLKMYGTQWF